MTSRWTCLLAGSWLAAASASGDSPSASLPASRADGVTAQDDGLSFSLLDAEITEPELGPAEVRVEVQASRRLGPSASLTWETIPVTAQTPADFTPASGSVTIPAGGISAVIPIRIEPDAAYEGPESFRVRLTATSEGLIGRSEATVVILDADVPRLSTTSATVETEGDSGPQPWSATLSLPAPPEKDTLVPIRTGGTARRGSDYTLSATSLLWPAGQPSIPFPWQGLGDVLTEDEETVTIASERPGIPVPATAIWLPGGSVIDEPHQILGFSLDGNQLALVSIYPPGGTRLRFYNRHPAEGWQVTHSSETPSAGSPRLALRDRQCLLGIGGQVLLWQRSDTGWAYQRILTPGSVDTSRSAPDVALSDSVAAFADGELLDQRKLYIHYRHFGGPEAWGRIKRIELETANPGSAQISDMALDGDWLILGRATYEYVSDGQSLRGAIEIRHRHAGGPDQWGVVTRLLNTDSNPFQFFGSQVSLSGRTLAFRLGTNDTPSQGIAIFERSGDGIGSWNRLTAVPAPSHYLPPFALAGDWLATVDGSPKTGKESGRERPLVIRHRHAGGMNAWGVAYTALASNRSLGGMGFEGPSLMLAHGTAPEGTAPVDSWEASDQAVLRIKDDDPAPVIMSLANASTIERNTTFGLPGTAQSAVDEDVTIEYEIVPLTVQVGSDIALPLRDSVRMRAGDTTFQAWVTMINDTIPEPDETYQIRLTGISRGKIVAAPAIGTIMDDDVDTRHAQVLLPFNNPARAQVPTAASYDDPWRDPGFDDSSWVSGLQGVGYETEPASANSYVPFLGLDLRTALFNLQTSVLVRLPFTLTDPLPQGGRWLLRHRVDDGMVLWINGQQIARVRAPATLAWNSRASDTSPENPGLPPVNSLVPAVVNALKPGPNLAAIHGLNATANSSDALIQIELSHFPILASSYLDAVSANALATVSTYWPSDDADRDGFSNGHEFAAGTNPVDPRSQPATPPLQIVELNDSLVVLEPGFNSLPDHTRLEVESSSSLAPQQWSSLATRSSGNPWQPVPPVTIDDTGRLLVPLLPGEARRYFRCTIHIDAQ